MYNLRCGMMEGWTEFRLLMKRGKTIFLLSVLAVMMWSFLYPVVVLEEYVGGGVSLFEPFIILVNSTVSTLGGSFFYIYLIFVAIISDLPSFTHGFRYRMVRMTRTGWFIGELTVIALFVLFYMVFLFVVSIVPFIRIGGNINRWSTCFEEVAWVNGLRWSDEVHAIMRLHVPDFFVTKYTVSTAFGLTAWYLMGYLLFSALFVVVLHTCFMRLRPMAVGILAIPYVFADIVDWPHFAHYFSPASLSRLSCLNFRVDNYYVVPNPSLAYASIWWGAWLAGLSVLLFIAAKKLCLDGYLNREE